jgi:hypothetical protein
VSNPVVLTALIGGCASVAVALIGLFGVIIPKIHKNTASLGEVREQVRNSHGTNLRDDLDFIRDVLLETRTDVAWIRREQLDQARRLTILEDH